MERKSLYCIVIFTVLITTTLLLAGCIGGDYVANRDIVVIKLHPDGSTAWTKLIDTGKDDAANDLIQTSNGDFVIAAQNSSERISPPRPRLILLSSGGMILWDRLLSESFGELTAVVQTSDGGYAAVSYEGEIWRLDPAGKTQWSRSTGIQGVWSVIETGDRGYVITGEQEGRVPFGSVVTYGNDGTVSWRQPYENESRKTAGCSETSIQTGPHDTYMVTVCTVPYEIVSQATVVKLDGEGNISWQRSYGTEGLDSVWSVMETSPQEGYLVSAYGKVPDGGGNTTNYLYGVFLQPNGTVVHITQLDRSDYFLPALMKSIPGGYVILYADETVKPGGSISIQPMEVHLDTEGRITNTQFIDTSIAVIPTADGGYFSAGFPMNGGVLGYSESIYGRADDKALHAMKLNPDTSRAWDRTISGVVVNYAKKVIQTSDGGYAILAVKENY